MVPLEVLKLTHRSRNFRDNRAVDQCAGTDLNIEQLAPIFKNFVVHEVLDANNLLVAGT